jgi:cytochrome P450
VASGRPGRGIQLGDPVPGHLPAAGSPPEDRPQFQSLIDGSFDFSLSEKERGQAKRALIEYMRTLADRAQAGPGEGLGMLVRERGEELSQGDLVGIGVTLLQAGHEITADMIASSCSRS